jgi:hypothetical protein
MLFYILPILALMFFSWNVVQVLKQDTSRNSPFLFVFAFFPIFMFAFFSFCLAQSSMLVTSLFTYAVWQVVNFVFCLQFVAFKKDPRDANAYANSDSKTDYSYQTH